MNIRRIISGALAAVIIAGSALSPQFFPAGANIAASAEMGTYNGFSYTEVSKGKIRIDRYDGKEKNIAVPKTIKGKPVVSIASGAFEFKAEEHESITLPEGITSIGDNAFGGCVNLTELKLPESLKKIGSEAFGSCIGLKSIYIPAKVNDIRPYAFLGCTSLEKIEVSPENKNYTSIDGVLFTKDKKELVAYPLNKCEDYAVPDGTETVPTFAFKDSLRLKSVYIPDTVTLTGQQVFWGCENLETVRLSKTKPALDFDLFYGCKSLESFTVRSGCFRIESSAFRECTSLKKLVIPYTVGEINNSNGISLKDCCPDVVIYCRKNSLAESYAKENDIPCVIDDDESRIGPPIPGDLTAKKASSGKLKLSWTASRGADGYTLYTLSSYAEGLKKVCNIKGGRKSKTIPMPENEKGYFLLRPYRLVNGKKAYGQSTRLLLYWSANEK